MPPRLRETALSHLPAALCPSAPGGKAAPADAKPADAAAKPAVSFKPGGK
jgi:hypothetical protein